MRILYVPLSCTNPEKDDLYKAFCKYDTLFYGAFGSAEDAIDFKPDVVYVHSGAIKVEDLKFIKKHTGAVVAQWAGDYRPEGFDYYREAAGVCDVNFKADTDKIYDFETKYLPHGIAEWQFREINPEAEGIIFIGNSYTQFPGGLERYELCKFLSPNLTWYGSPNPQINFYDIPDEYNRHRFGISANIYAAPGWFGNRPLMIMAAGAIAIIRKYPGIEKHFKDGHDCHFYDGGWKDFTYSEHIARAGQETARNYTYDKIVNSFLCQL